MDDTMDLLHDQGFHHHILSLPLNNVTLRRVFCPIYRTLTAVEHDAYEESDLRLVDHQPLQLPPFVLPIPAPHPPSPTLSLDDPTPSPLLHSLHNQISSSAHSSVVRGHVEFLTLGSSTSEDEKSVRLRPH